MKNPLPYSRAVANALRIAQVTPYVWEDEREVNRFVKSLSEAFAARGHDVTIVAPANSRKLVRSSRAAIRSGELQAVPAGEPRVLGIGQSLPFPPARLGGTTALPIDIASTLEQLFALDCFDIVHVHEPFAPSASSAALRLSRTLNVGTFHQPTERTLSTQVARRFVELFFGRLDARVALDDATRDLVSSFFAGEYEVLGPAAEPLPNRPPRAGDRPVRIFLSADEERAAARILIRALRKLPRELEWEATIRLPVEHPVPPASLSNRLRQRIDFVGTAGPADAELLARSDIVVAASAGIAPSPVT